MPQCAPASSLLIRRFCCLIDCPRHTSWPSHGRAHAYSEPATRTCRNRAAAQAARNIARLSRRTLTGTPDNDRAEPRSKSLKCPASTNMISILPPVQRTDDFCDRCGEPVMGMVCATMRDKRASGYGRTYVAKWAIALTPLLKTIFRQLPPTTSPRGIMASTGIAIFVVRRCRYVWESLNPALCPYDRGSGQSDYPPRYTVSEIA